MKSVNQRVQHMRFTAVAATLSFVTMFFTLIACGVDWYRLDLNGETKRQTLFYQVERNTDFAKKVRCSCFRTFPRTCGAHLFHLQAGDPAFAFLVLAIIAYVIAIYATYLRWSGRDGRLPHTWQATAGYYGVCSFCLFLCFVIYAGVVNASSDKLSGHFGGGFAFAIIMWLVMGAFAYLIYHFRGEVEKHTADPGTAAAGASAPGAFPSGDGSIAGTNPISSGGAAADPSALSPMKERWAKLKVHSIILLVDLVFILLTIVTLGAPWYDASGVGHFGLLESNIRHSSKISPASSAMRKAGDATFFFVLVALLSQIYATIAITLRMLGRNDKFSGRVPHGLNACLISTGVSSICCFLSFCVYAGVANDKVPSANKGHFGGGFALIILDWLFTIGILAILWLKKDEVDNAPAVTDPSKPDTVYPPPQQPGEYRANPYGPSSGDQYADPQPGSFLPSQGAPVPPPAAPVEHGGGYDTQPVVGYDAGQYGNDDDQPAV